jgi:hypothetical protein
VQETLRRQRGIHTDIRPMASQIRVGLLFWIYDSGLTALALDQQLPRVHEPAEMFVPWQEAKTLHQPLAIVLKEVGQE